MTSSEIRPGDPLVYRNGVLCKAENPEQAQYIAGFYGKDDLISIGDSALSTSERIPVLTQVLDWHSLRERKPGLEIDKKLVNEKVRFHLSGCTITVSDLLPVFGIDNYSGDDRPVSYVEVAYNQDTSKFDIMFAYAPEKVSIGFTIK